MLARYEVGQAAVENGSDIVTGYGTSWLTYITPGAALVIDGASATVAEVLEVGKLRITAPWTGASVGPIHYHIDL